MEGSGCEILNIFLQNLIAREVERKESKEKKSEQSEYEGGTDPPPHCFLEVEKQIQIPSGIKERKRV